jgi:endonuclease YncB( thermonuclease family)
MAKPPPTRWLCLILLAAAWAVPGPAAAGDIVSYAIVQSDASLRVQGKTIRLFGTYIPDGSRICRRDVRPALCGTRAANALEMKIRGFVRCTPVAQLRDRSISAICTVEEGSILDPPVDLGAWLIELGLAVATPDAPFEYGVLERIARSNQRGVWGFQVDGIRRR